MRIIVVLPTFYTDANDIRFKLAQQTLKECKKFDLEAIVVDASPSEQVRQLLSSCHQDESSNNNITNDHNNNCIRVVKQTFKGKKGAALVEGIKLAQQDLAETQGVICFQEPEKVDMVREWRTIAKLLYGGDQAQQQQQQQQHADICVPRRSKESFISSYPIEQYHSESFVNLYLDALAQEVGFPSIDWTIGPVAFCPNVAKHWTDGSYVGDLWDMQLVPMIRAQRWYGARVIEHEFDFILSREMKEQETGVAQWSEKRLFQLNHLFERVGGALKEEKNPAT